LVLLAGGLVVPSLFALIDSEIGARRRGPRGRIAATAALVGIALLWAVRDYEHRRAVGALQARSYNGAEPVRVSAYPKWIDPFHWYGVVETSAFFVLAPVDSIGPEVDPKGEEEIRYKPEETPVTLAAKNSYLGRVYLDWAQYPVLQSEPLPESTGGYLVHFEDLRYRQMSSAINRNRGRGALTATVMLDKNLRVVGDVYETDEERKIVPEPAKH
jgi:inner membrane protein